MSDSRGEASSGHGEGRRGRRRGRRGEREPQRSEGQERRGERRGEPSGVSRSQKREAIQQLISERSLPAPAAGELRFYYQREKGRVDYLSVDAEGLTQLQRGALIPAADQSHALCFIDEKTASTIRTLDPEWSWF